MTDAQMVTLAVAILAVFAGTLFNNSRIGDIDRSLSRHIDDKFNLLTERLQRMDDNVMRILGDREERIQRLEGKK